MFVIAILIIMLLILLTFACASYALFLNYKNTTTAFYNHYKELLESIVQSNTNTNLELSVIAESLNTLADELEEVDTSVDMYLDRLMDIEKLVEQEKIVNEELNKTVSSIAETSNKIKLSKLVARRKFKSYH